MGNVGNTSLEPAVVENCGQLEQQRSCPSPEVQASVAKLLCAASFEMSRDTIARATHQAKAAATVEFRPTDSRSNLDTGEGDCSGVVWPARTASPADKPGNVVAAIL